MCHPAPSSRLHSGVPAEMLKSSRTSIYDITCIRVYTQLKHLWVCMRAVSLYVCASVYRCICMEAYMYVRVFIGVYAWKFICMCECL